VKDVAALAPAPFDRPTVSGLPSRALAEGFGPGLLMWPVDPELRAPVERRRRPLIFGVVMRRRIVRVQHPDHIRGRDALGTFTFDVDRGVVTWRAYRSHTVAEVRICWLVGILEWHSTKARAARRRLQRSARRRMRVAASG